MTVAVGISTGWRAGVCARKQRAWYTEELTQSGYAYWILVRSYQCLGNMDALAAPCSSRGNQWYGSGEGGSAPAPATLSASADG
jgi:hypothetical protein